MEEIADFIDESLFKFDSDEEDAENVVCSYLTEELQKVKEKTNKAKQILEDKKQFREKIVSTLYTEKCKILSDETLEYETPVEVFQPFQKVNKDKWIVGFKLKNIYAKSVKDLNHLIKANDEKSIVYEQKIFKNNESQFSEVDEVYPGNEVFILSTLPLPSFRSYERVELSSRLLYVIENRFLQIAVPCFQISVDDIVNSKYNVNLDKVGDVTDDLLAILSSTEETKFIFKYPNEEFFNLGFIKDDLYACGFTDVLYDVGMAYMILRHNYFDFLLHCSQRPAENYEFDIKVYTRSKQDIIILLRHLVEKITRKFIIIPDL